jgi:phosphohistidine phosphatase
MRLLFIRHAIAVPADSFQGPDADRPLTDVGKQRFRRVAARLAQFAPRPAAILSSPLRRARETADLAARAWPKTKVTLVPALADGDWPSACEALVGFSRDDTVVLVGHEGWISAITARLLGCKRAGALAYRKGGVALLDIEDPASDKGTLLWFIPPRVLLRLDAPT